MDTQVYHITYYDYTESAYVQFLGCNFKCLGCIRKRFVWDHHLYEDGSSKEVMDGEPRTLTLEELEGVIKRVKKEMGLKRVVLGGGEPTIDPAFCSTVKALSDIELEIALLTNGLLLDKVIDCMPKGSTIELSVKSIYPERFSAYTKRDKSDLDMVLRNMRLAYQSGFKVIVETVLIPGFNEPQDVEVLAEYVASSLSENVPMIIDEYVPVPSAPWRRPTLKELLEAKERSEEHLRKVLVRSSYTCDRLSKVYVIYPEPSELKT